MCLGDNMELEMASRLLAEARVLLYALARQVNPYEDTFAGWGYQQRAANLIPAAFRRYVRRMQQEDHLLLVTPTQKIGS